MEGESTILLGKVGRMRKSETMRAAPRLLLSHPIVCLLAASAAVMVVGVLGPIKVVHAADAAVEGENFANKPTGATVVNDTLFSGGKALKFTADGIAWDTTVSLRGLTPTHVNLSPPGSMNRSNCAPPKSG